ncbi:hypothetical protein [Polymorphobacter fuscus]|uniref:Uncharacterized protein n=1 Tax=Sandarakinorhabdus fusca TaxID=1439888 RepID=A0A7C9KPM6_9SPHN|nr:hypothetical protein [Polymorphobacter fuscus]KAB7643921.1 hypothetical protein F9290_15330 [Polymorphobacter fuscus]MQT18624.1 hypothetical protein [Polymorphobacter fuscus]NJC07009.1 hypothetical protein [Polymorphobacter fuscus]
MNNDHWIRRAGGTVRELRAVKGPGFGLGAKLVGWRYDCSLLATTCASLVIFGLSGCAASEPTAQARDQQTSGNITTFDAQVAKAKRRAVLVESAKIKPTAHPKARRAGLPSCALEKAESDNDGKAAQRFVNYMKQANKPSTPPIISPNTSPKGLRFLRSVACDVQFPNGPIAMPTSTAHVPVSDTDRAAIAAMDKKFCVVLVPCQPRLSPAGGEQINSPDAGNTLDTNLTALGSEEALRKRLETCDPKLLQQCPV